MRSKSLLFLLAEFIIHLSEENNTFDKFKKVLLENCAEFSDSFVANLLRIIQHMKPNKGTSDSSIPSKVQADNLSMKFPGLAIPNEPIKNFAESDDEGKVCFLLHHL